SNPIGGAPLLPSDFYVHAAIFVALWSGLLVMLFTRRLRSGLLARIGELARQLAESRLASGLFPQLEQATADVRLARERLEALALSTTEIRREIASLSTLGAQLAPLNVQRSPPALAALSSAGATK